MGLSTLNLSHSTDTCVHCQSQIDNSARFCGECGAVASKSRSSSTEIPAFASVGAPVPLVRNQHSVSRTQPADRSPQRAPNFAQVHKEVNKEIPPALRDELGQAIVLLARERLFLYVHCSIFLGMNLCGFWLALTAYHQYMADEMTRFVVALTPMMFFNTVALACLVPIKGTKREIARLKEKITFLRFQIDTRSIFKS